NPENAAIGTVVAFHFVVMALIFVIPINEINRAIGPGLKIDDLGPGIVEIDRVGLVMADEAGALWFEAVAVEAGAVDVVHVGPAAKFGRPVVVLIDHETGVRMAAAGGGGAGVA